MALSLPSNPDLERFRRDARRLQRAVRSGDDGAVGSVTAHHPLGASAVSTPSEFTLAAAQLTVARGSGFASWPRLRDYLRAVAPLRRDPAALAAAGPERDPARAVPLLGCLLYTDSDEPARWREADALLRRHEELCRSDVFVAATAGDAAALRTHLEADPGSARREGGPFGWEPLLYLAYSRVPQVDAVSSAQMLLEAGADPDAGYLWQGLVPPFTVLTGLFGEGEQGPGRQPRHREWAPLASLVLSHGADPNDRQALYNRMFTRDDSHLALLLAHGLGRPGPEVWTTRLGVAAESIEEMMTRQLRWAQDHGLAARLALLARHGFVHDGASGRGPDVHRAASAEAVRTAVAAGAEVDVLRDGHTALHRAAFLGDVELVRALLDAGADPLVLDLTHGSTALGWAEHGRCDATAEVLRGLSSPPWPARRPGPLA